MEKMLIMKPAQIKKHAPLIYSILGCKNADARNVILSNLNDNSLDFICSCIREIIYHPNKLNIPDNKIKFLRKQLAKDKKKLLYLARSKGNRKRKRTIIANQMGKGIGVALATALPFLISSIKSLIKGRKK